MPIIWILLATALLSAVFAAAIGRVLIPYLKKIHFGQTILEIGPRWHKNKQGTPIMGGFMFIISSVVTVIAGYVLYRIQCVQDGTDPEIRNGMLRLIACVVFSLLFSCIGFADDYIKAVKKQNLGLRPRQKMAAQFLLCAGFLAVLYALGDHSTELDLIFCKLDLHFFYYPIMILFMIYLSNAVNLTDGVDGLCGTVTAVAMLAFTMICSKEISLYAIAIAGGCLGFLVWNLHPAKCFMGDTGSMYLGASVAAIGLASHQHLSMILVALVYILEALSVMIQVTYFKYTKKKYGEGRRIFKMTPIHHHFEMSGFSEYKIVITFSLFGAVTGLCGLLLVLL